MTFLCISFQYGSFWVRFQKAENEAKQEREGLRNEKERDEGDEEEHLLLQEFEEEIADISVPSANIEEMKGEMQKEFDNIIDEVRTDARNARKVYRL